MSILMAFLSRCSSVEHVDIQYIVSFSLNDFECSWIMKKNCGRIKKVFVFCVNNNQSE